MQNFKSGIANMKNNCGTTVDKNIMIHSCYPINTDISNLIIQLRDASLSKGN